MMETCIKEFRKSKVFSKDSFRKMKSGKFLFK